MSQFLYLIPALTILIGALVLMFMSMYEKFTVKNFIVVSSLFLLIALGFTLSEVGNSYSVQPFDHFLNNVFTFDTFSNLFNILLIAGTLLTLLIGEHYFQHRSYFKGEFFSILLFALFGMMVLAHANELVTAFIALEIASFSVYIMVGYNSNDSKRVEAIFKYLVLGSFIGAFYLLGVVLIYGATASTNLADISAFITSSDSDSMILIYIGFTLILFTFLFKIAAFPFQSWVLDVYRGAPMVITGYMASTFKIAIFSFFLRAILVYFAPIIDFWDTIISETNVRVTYNDFKGLAHERPFLAAMMTVFLFSLAGIPSTVGFIAKFYVFTEAINAGYTALAIVAIFATIVSVYYYFKLIAVMYFYPAPLTCSIEGFNDKRVSTYAIAFVALLTVLGGIGSAIVFFIPSMNIDAIINLTQVAVQSLFIK